MYIPTCIHDSDESPTDIGLLMFSGLGKLGLQSKTPVCTRKYRCNHWNCVPNLCRTEDILHVIRRSQVVDTTSGFELQWLSGGYYIDLFCFHHSPVIFRKSHESVSVNSLRLRNGSKKSGLGGTFTPPPPLATHRLINIS